jgi:hypothetical protein
MEVTWTLVYGTVQVLEVYLPSCHYNISFQYRKFGDLSVRFVVY